jgi:hypothetical protein
MHLLNIQTGVVRFAFAALITVGLCPGFQAPQSIAARANPNEYQAQARAGNVTIAADFAQHSVTTPDAVYSTEDYIVFEVAFFGPAGTKAFLKPEDFTLRIKGKKQPFVTQPAQLTFHSLKDPEWEQTVTVEKAQKAGGISTGGGGGNNDPPPSAPKMPIATERRMEQRVQKAALPEGDRTLPEAGLIFFAYRGKTTNLGTLELIYNGAAGKATLQLQP